MPTTQVLVQLAVYLAVLLLLAWPLGKWLAAVADGRLPCSMAPLVWFEHALYRLAGVDAAKATSWKRYAIDAVAFNALGIFTVYALQRLQAFLPLNPQGMAAVSPDSSFNTAISFVTNTNWQGYAGESTMSYLTQMLALTVQNFFSAATAIAVVWALIRGFVARSGGTVGNFWVDMVRSTLYVLMTHRQLLRQVRGPGRVEHTQYLRVFMASLRRKLEDDPAQPKLITTETGVGYRLLAA